MKKHIILLFTLITSFYLDAYTFKKYQVNNGLSENSVKVIIQDHLGFMWFGTKDGLNRFDGYEFKVYKNIPHDTSSLGNNFIRSIYQDKSHNFWVGTDSYLYLFNYMTRKFSPFLVKSNLNQIINSGVSSLCYENDSLLWIGTLKQGAFCFNRKTKKLIQFTQTKDNSSLKTNVIRTIYMDYAGTIWVGTREGLSRYNRETNSFFTYTTKNTAETLANDEILSIYQDSEGKLWVGTWGGGLCMLNRDINIFDSFLSPSNPPFVSHIRSIIEYNKSSLLVGADDGLYLFDKIKRESKRIDNPKDYNSLSDQNVHAIYKDHEGGIWLGTYFGGANYMSPNADVIEHYYPNLSEHSLSGKAVSQFCEDTSGNLWVATEDGGLNYFDTKTKHFKVYSPTIQNNSISYHNIHSLTIDGDNLWIGTFSRGIDILNMKTGHFKNYTYHSEDKFSVNDNCIFSIYKDSRGDIYVGTPFGLCRYDRNNDNFIRIPEVPAFVYDMKEDNLGSLWIASYSDGAYRFNYKTNKWKNYRHLPAKNKSIAFDKLTCVYFDGKQRLWFATEGRGICKYNYKTDNFTTYNESNGLPNNVVYSILDDKYGNIWLSSNGGISKFNPDNLKIKTYTREDGLQGNQFNYRSGYKSKEGVFYFGGINGFNAFNPDKLTQNTNIPPVVITLFEILSENKPLEINVDQKITLKHDQSSFRINFVSLSFQAQEKNSYMYMMEGLDNKWTDIGAQRTLSFVNLPSGKYVFRVKGSNNDGIWNDKATTIEITILPPFWKSIFAKIIYLLLILSAAYYTFLYFKKKLNEKHNSKLELFRKEKEREMIDTKIEFFTNIAHEIRTPVSLIKAPLESIIKSEDGNVETKENLSVIEKNTEHLLELINQLLDFRKIDEQRYSLELIKVNIKQLLTETCYRFHTTIESRQIKLSLDLPDEDVYAYVDKEALTKIISNLIHNALKYTSSYIGISLTETLQSNEKYFEIRVSDNGSGIDDDMKNLVFEPFFQTNGNQKGGTGIGLTLARQLAINHNGDIQIENADEKGCIFIVSIPENIDNEHINIYESSNPLHDNLLLTDDDQLKNKKTTILVVEDNEELRNFLSKNLSKEHNVISASDGMDALSKLEKSSVDLIISDIIMPELDGLELAKTIKQNEQYCHIPIVLLSAKTNTQTKVEGLEYGADSYIEKPFSISILKAQINSLIENRIKILEKFSRSPITPYGTIAHNAKDKLFLDKLNMIIEENMANDQFRIEYIADKMFMSQSNLQRKIKGISGMVPSDYIRVFKLKKAAEILKTGEYRINEVCFIVGFNNPSYFSKCFQKQFGILPKDLV